MLGGVGVADFEADRLQKRPALRVAASAHDLKAFASTFSNFFRSNFRSSSRSASSAARNFAEMGLRFFFATRRLVGTAEL
jgi:hypothetical protein